MNNRNTIIISSLTLLLGMSIGRVALTPTSHELATCNPQTDTHASLGTQPAINSQAGQNLPASAVHTAPHAQNEHTPQGTPPINQPINPSNSKASPATEQARDHGNEISDEDIDKLIPPPFNQIAKGRHGQLRENYKNFAATNQPNDKDLNLANKMTDFILSNPYAKSIHLDSVVCKSELCELRLYEIKPGTWSVIFSEMGLQDWWEGTSQYEAVNTPTQFNNQTVSATYILFQRMPKTPFPPALN